VTTGRWEVSALIADKFSSGRVFLAGDAAHTLPAARGGYGANTGIEDAHNLAWKLDAVLSGTSTMELLDTYDADLSGEDWVLLTEDERWRPAAVEASVRSGVVLRCVRIGGDVVPTEPAAFRAAFGFGSEGGLSRSPGRLCRVAQHGLPSECGRHDDRFARQSGVGSR
jgi:2-polyprenyl-6-methoxyphenol hydroxylase-like FAD-dependent oxidoreductase